MTEQIVITGVGLATPLGLDVETTWRALLDGAFVTDKGVVPVARDDHARVEQLALIAASEAIGAQDVSGVPLFVGTSKGAADQWLFDNQTGLYGLDTLAETLARELCLGDRVTYSAACASGLQALCVATMRMRHEPSRPRAVVVASESSLHQIWSQTFKRLGVLAPPGEPCRPFDADRRGFVISEAAAAIVLERRVPRVGDVVVADACFGSDAFHLTGTDPDAALLRHLIARVAGDGPIDWVHAHATATGNDDVELAAIERTLREPIVYSHKGAIGHTLGASGLVSVAINVRVHATHAVPPMTTTRRSIVPPRSATPGEFRSSLCLASGFGGATAVVRLERIR